MIRLLAILTTGICCSLYLFPFQFTFFPVGNTKIYLAVLGLLLFVLNRISNRNPASKRSMIYVSLAALGVSLAGIFSVLLNGTYDYAYAQYIVSMWVWAGAAYFVVQCMKRVHGNVTVELIGLYVIGVCVAQCCFALMNEFLPAFKNVVDALVEQQTEFLTKVERMYGIGASLDTGGSRFACALIMLAYIATEYAKNGGRNGPFLCIVICLFISCGEYGGTHHIGRRCHRNRLFPLYIERRITKLSAENSHFVCTNNGVGCPHPDLLVYDFA